VTHVEKHGLRRRIGVTIVTSKIGPSRIM